MQVKIYTTPTCQYCKQTKAFLTENKIEYTAIDVADDEKAAHEMIEKSGQMGVPVTVITTDDGKEELIIGFDQPKLAQVLGL